MKDILIALVSGGAITYILGWMAGRKKHNAEVEKIRLENLEEAIKIYEKIHNELRGQLENVSEKCSELSVQIEQLQEENKKLKQEIHLLTKKLKEKNDGNRY